MNPRAGRVTLRDDSKSWASAPVGRANTLRIAENALRLHILPTLGDRPMHAVRRSDVRALVKVMLGDSWPPGTVRNVYVTLARLFPGCCRRSSRGGDAPASRIVLPAGSRTPEWQPPSIEACGRRLRRAVEPRYRAAVVLLAGSGLRIGELLGAQVSDVDFLRRTIRVERQRLQDNTIAPTKTWKSVRTEPLGQVVVDELRGAPCRASVR